MSDSITHLEKLVGFATISSDSNLALMDYVEDVLQPLGFVLNRVTSENGLKANLYASIGPQEIPGIILSGHSDVVPVAGQNWSSDPFVLRHDSGKLYGRGSADMKGFLACCLAAAPALANAQLSMPVHFAFSYDEEVGCIGVRRLLDILEPQQPTPRFCIIGEPTMMQIATAHKGKLAMRVSCVGLEAHSSLAPNGVNAVHLAMDMIAAIRDLQDELASSGARDGDYDIPYTTLHVGRIWGGEALNIVPNQAGFDFEIRHLPADDPTTLIARLQERAGEIVKTAREKFAGADISFDEINSYPALDTPPDSEVVAFLRKLTGSNSHAKLSFGTEGGLFQSRLGLPVVVMGPGSIGVAHKPDEYIEESQMALCDDFLAKLIAELLV